MESRLLVSQVMSKKLITLHPSNKIDEAEEIFRKYNLHHILVMVGDELVGLLSMGDVLFAKTRVHEIIEHFKLNQSYKTTTVKDLMSSNLTIVQHNETVSFAAAKMVTNRINALPVFKQNELCGIITSFDIMKSICK